jgi:SAM-dependent methyltransferase
MQHVRTRQEWFNRLRAEWFRVLRPLGSWVPWELRNLVALDEQSESLEFWGEGLMVRARQLAAVNLRNCTVVPTREDLLHRLPKGGRVAEVGVLHGQFSRSILELAAPDELHLIDHRIEPGVRALAAEDLHGRVQVHEGDSSDVLQTFSPASFDWIYIDAQHTYEGVARDIQAAQRVLKSDGLLVFNDYTPWSYVEMQPYGVVAAVNDLCLDGGWEVVYLALPAHMYCDVAVRRIR